MTQRTLASSGLVASGAILGAIVTLFALRQRRKRQRNEKENSDNEEDHCGCKLCFQDAQHRRERLPSLIILVRHGESEGNVDREVYTRKPDHLVELTKRGIGQAKEAGKHIEAIFKEADEKSGGRGSSIRRVHLVVSPFERTRATAAAMRPWFEHRIVRTDVQPRIREQEFGNIQGDDFQKHRKNQKKVGRFWYRFPTGESGADVYDRVKSWWYDSVLNVNERVGYDQVDAMVVVTHGLTMRFALMQLFGWSPTTFHSIWNAGNCDAYVLKKDLSKPGMSPYVLDEDRGSTPKSSIDLQVEFSSQPGNRVVYKLEDYLSIPPPRTLQLDIVKEKLAAQFPEIDKDDISRVVFMPFIDGAIVQKRTTCGKRVSLVKDSKHKVPESTRKLSFPEESWHY